VRRVDENAAGHLERLLAKEAITERLLAYARGVDRLDLDLVRATFHPGAEADYGEMFRGTGEGFADFIGEVHPPMETHTHHLSNISVTVDGDRAGSEAYVIVRTRTRAADGTAQEMVSHGRYADQWERRAGEWRISRRRYLHSLDEAWTARTTLFPPGGSRDGDDPSYDLAAAP
jgi:hypothetical protein